MYGEGDLPGSSRRRLQPSERFRVGDAGEGPGRVVVGPHLAGRGVRDGDVVLDVGEGAVEDPEAAVDGAAVEDLYRELESGKEPAMFRASAKRWSGAPPDPPLSLQRSAPRRTTENGAKTQPVRFR
jgi:hypothetical protein